MDNNALTTLAFSIYPNKGMYALLLGAGISRSSGIPSGWDIVIDLLKKLAALNGENDFSDYEQWYYDKFGKAVDYSSLLGELVKTPTEWVNLMKSYFEPTEEEAESHLKEPTKAHRAIAQMAKNGFLKMILTTNFDRLLEIDANHSISRMHIAGLLLFERNHFPILIQRKYKRITGYIYIQ